MKYERNIADYVPSYYRELKESDELLASENGEIAQIYGHVSDVQAQTRVSSATWALKEWERILAIKADESLSVELRRSAILSKLRGVAPATKETLLSVMEAHTQSKDNEITQRYGEYTVQYIADISNALNYNALVSALRTYTPAHLALEIGTSNVSYDAYASVTQSGEVVTLYPHE